MARPAAAVRAASSGLTFRVLAFALAAGAAPAHAEDALPARKAGLWEVRTVVGNSGAGLTVRQCVDAETDIMMLSLTGPLADTACPRRDVRRSGDTVTVEAACTVKDKAATARAVITGSFERAYQLTVTAQGDAMPSGPMTMTMTGKWLGPCTAGQKPGDMIMPDGRTLNVLEGRAPRQGPDPLDLGSEAERRPSWWCRWPLTLLAACRT